MANKKVTRRALFTSIMSLILCCAMLMGTTFAWFTDSVTSTENIIKSGTLDVTMHWADGIKAVPEDNSSEWTDASTGAIFNYDKWEPGYTEVRHVKIANVGTLALQYQLSIQANGNVSELADAIDVYFVDPAVQVAARSDLTEESKAGTLSEVLAGMPVNTHATLISGEKDTITIALKMRETADNEYQNKSIGASFSVILNATQLSYEKDSFDTLYDSPTKYPVTGSVSGSLNGETASAVDLKDVDTGAKFGSVVVPAEAVAENDFSINIHETAVNSNITIEAGEDAVTYDISVTGLRDENAEALKFELKIPAGLDPNTVKVYHNEELIASHYNPNTGYVTFESATFSPFTIVYDAEDLYEAPVAGAESRPTATVTDYTEIDNIQWGNYGQWSPTEGLEANLETAYKFTCNETAEQAAQNPYAYWYCDFYVKLNQSLGENQIFLGGNYGSFGWVGFHNGDVTLEANQEIGLLESVTTNPWTYYDVANYVGEFICGVGDVDNALTGAEFTVMLRLTNPNDPNEYYDVETITHTFTANAPVAGE